MNGAEIVAELVEYSCSQAENWSGDWSHDWSGDWPHESWANDAYHG